MGGAAADDGSLPLCARINCHALVVGTCFVAFVMIAVCGAAAYYLRMHAIRAREALDLEAVDGAQTSHAHTAQYRALVKTVCIAPRTLRAWPYAPRKRVLCVSKGASMRCLCPGATTHPASADVCAHCGCFLRHV